MESQNNLWMRLRAERSPDEFGQHVVVLFVGRFFKIQQRQSTILRELQCGLLHFVSAGFILSVNSTLLCENNGFLPNQVAASTALSTGLSCIICGVLSNLPFVLAPTTSTSIYFALYIQNNSMSKEEGNLAVFLLAILFTFCGWRPIALFVSNLIPFVMKVGVCLGVGLLIALEALYEIGLVQTGEHTVLDIGEFTTTTYIAMFAFVVIGLALHYRIRGAFLIGLVFGTFLYWIVNGKSSDWPPQKIFLEAGDFGAKTSDILWKAIDRGKVYRLVFDLYIIGVILLNGLAHGLAETAGLKREDNTLPRGKWLYASCGLGTLLSAFLGSGPIMISPESAPAIKAGARTGLSSVVCGLLFLLSIPLCPLFAAVPTAGTSPVLLMIGMFMFENAGKVDWGNIREALPVFVMAVFVPFTYSIFNGVTFGFGIYMILLVCTEGPAVRRKCRRQCVAMKCGKCMCMCKGACWCYRKLRKLARNCWKRLCCCCIGRLEGRASDELSIGWSEGMVGEFKEGMDADGDPGDNSRHGSFDGGPGLPMLNPLNSNQGGYVSLSMLDSADADSHYKLWETDQENVGGATVTPAKGQQYSHLRGAKTGGRREARQVGEGRAIVQLNPGTLVIEQHSDSDEEHDDDELDEGGQNDSDDEKRLTFVLSEVGSSTTYTSRSCGRDGSRSPNKQSRSGFTPGNQAIISSTQAQRIPHNHAALQLQNQGKTIDFTTTSASGAAEANEAIVGAAGPNANVFAWTRVGGNHIGFGDSLSGAAISGDDGPRSGGTQGISSPRSSDRTIVL